MSKVAPVRASEGHVDIEYCNTEAEVIFVEDSLKLLVQ